MVLLMVIITTFWSRLFITPWVSLKFLLAALVTYNLLGLVLALFSSTLDWGISKLIPSLKKNFHPWIFGAFHGGAALFLSLFYYYNKVVLSDYWAFSLKGYLFNAGFLAGVMVIGGVIFPFIFRLSPRIFKWSLAGIVALFIIGDYTFYFKSLSVQKQPARAPEVARRDSGLKVILFGIDGVTWDVLDGLIDEGKAPNFTRLVEGGFSDRFRTILPTMSPIIWTTIATGKNPEKHGIIERTSPLVPGMGNALFRFPQILGAKIICQLMIQRGIFKTVPVSSTVRQSKALWNINTDYDLTTLVLGWWGTWPPDSIKGSIVSDLASARKKEMRAGKKQYTAGSKLALSRSARTYPAELELELEPFNLATQALSLSEANCFFPADSNLLNRINDVTKWDSRDFTTAVKFGYLADKYYFLSAKFLMDREDWDCVMLYLNQVDVMEHYFWRYYDSDAGLRKKFGDMPFEDVVPNTYLVMDRMLGDIMSFMDDSTVLIIVSDHGFETYRTKFGLFTDHTQAPDGIIIAYGKGVQQKRQRTGEYSVHDVTPTVMTLLGIPLGRDMDGRVMEGIFEDGFLNRYRPEYVKSHDRGFIFRRNRVTQSDVDDELLDKMRALGYIK